MKTFARIEHDTVRELLTAEELPEFHPDLEWIEVTHIAGIAEGWQRQDDGFAAPTITIDLAALKAQALAAIDAAGGAERLRYITAIPGQDGTYVKKEGEALRWVAAGRPGTLAADDYPYASAEAAATGADITDVLATYLAQSQLMNRINAAIEATRFTAKQRVTAATTADEVQAILAALVWPQPG